ncbi:MAG: hypothetical protein CL607_18725 [Anaerolineaceae bacterium]|nr:hypothetical protein [Anaerolineaceae bacterium]
MSDIDTRILSQLEKKTAQPKYISGQDDPWSAFRQVEIITLELIQQYKHSLGKYSRFFIELENGRFLGTKCSRCQTVYTPPRPLCSKCTKITDWHELPGTGSVKTYSVMHYSSNINDDVRVQAMPMVLAYVLLDGSSTLFPHLLRAENNEVHTDMRVHVTYNQGPVQHPIHLMYFAPLEE